jgi:hypothetical protein
MNGMMSEYGMANRKKEGSMRRRDTPIFVSFHCIHIKVERSVVETA